MSNYFIMFILIFILIIIIFWLLKIVITFLRLNNLQELLVTFFKKTNHLVVVSFFIFIISFWLSFFLLYYRNIPPTLKITTKVAGKKYDTEYFKPKANSTYNFNTLYEENIKILVLDAKKYYVTIKFDTNLDLYYKECEDCELKPLLKTKNYQIKTKQSFLLKENQNNYYYEITIE